MSGEVLRRKIARLASIDADSLEMMGMTSQGRFIEFCKPVVDEWSGKLRTIDGALAVWRKVQRNLCFFSFFFFVDVLWYTEDHQQKRCRATGVA